MRKLRRTGVVLAALVVVLACALGVSPYLRRWAWLGFPDVYDHDKLPARIVTHGPRSFQLPTASGGDWVSVLALSYGGRSLRDEAALAEFVAGHGTTALIVLKDGRLLAERYFNGFRRDSLFKSFSVTKSVLSALLGIAVAEGSIGSLDDPVTKYVPEMEDPGFARVTLRHCLDGTAGIEYTRGGLPWSGQPRMYYTTDVRRYVSTAVLRGEPGRSFTPEDLSPIVLGWVLERALAHHASARTLSAYLAERLWQPLGAEYDAVWNVDHEGEGLEKAESGLSARAIDLAKFALLYLQGGRWDGKQLVPAAWVAGSTTVAPGAQGPNVWTDGFHQRLWWGRKVPTPDRPDFYANGHFGQRLYVSPRRGLVLVRMGYENGGVDWTDFLAAVADAFR